MPWKTEWVPPEEAFEIRIQCTEAQIEHHCAAHPSNTRADFDAQGGLQIVVYHVYKNDEAYERLSFWYTLCDGYSGHDPADTEFDITSFPTFHEALDHQTIMQSAYDKGLCSIRDEFVTIQQDSQ